MQILHVSCYYSKKHGVDLNLLSSALELLASFGVYVIFIASFTSSDFMNCMYCLGAFLFKEEKFGKSIDLTYLNITCILLNDWLFTVSYIN